MCIIFDHIQTQHIYQGRCRSDNPPHIYAVADAAHQALLHHKQNQAIVISGESGAGKTESANLLLKQLVFLSKVKCVTTNNISYTTTEVGTHQKLITLLYIFWQAQNRNLEEKLLQMNPIMEAFGNARTGINANSSRFGKYLELSMLRVGRISGARISVYLLEQSRVIQQAM